MSNPAIEIKHEHPQPGTILEYMPARTGRPARLRVLGPIGTGSMCTVLACEPLGVPGAGGPSPRRLAAKVLDPARCGQPAEKRFEHEAELLCSLVHPNLVRALGSGSWRSSPQRPAAPFIVMELLEGRPLSAAIREESPLGFAEALGIVAGLARALGYMAVDGRVIAHRDIKPANVMLCNGRPVLIDLGVAKTAGGTSHDHGTRLVGTVRFMAPEQIADSTQADARSDIYALGMLLLDMWGCRRGRDTRDDLAQRFSGKPPRLSDDDSRRIGLAPEETAAANRLLARMCAYEPRERFQNHEQLVRAIDALLADAGAPPRLTRRARKRRERRRRFPFRRA